MQQPLRVAVVGAGMSGLFLGYHLKQAGLDFTIYEKRAAAGGTWDTNTYPGLHVDVLTRNYEFPFARSFHWSKRYAPGSEVRSYLQGFARNQDLLPHIRFGAEVVEALWEDGVWRVTLADGSAAMFDIVVAASGFLRMPSIPKVPGAETFRGRAFHSSRWDHTIDLTDRSLRYAVVGTGSSGVQITSALGNSATRSPISSAPRSGCRSRTTRRTRCGSGSRCACPGWRLATTSGWRRCACAPTATRPGGWYRDPIARR